MGKLRKHILLSVIFLFWEFTVANSVQSEVFNNDVQKRSISNNLPLSNYLLQLISKESDQDTARSNNDISEKLKVQLIRKTLNKVPSKKESRTQDPIAEEVKNGICLITKDPKEHRKEDKSQHQNSNRSSETSETIGKYYEMLSSIFESLEENKNELEIFDQPEETEKYGKIVRYLKGYGRRKRNVPFEPVTGRIIRYLNGYQRRKRHVDFETVTEATNNASATSNTSLSNLTEKTDGSSADNTTVINMLLDHATAGGTIELNTFMISMEPYRVPSDLMNPESESTKHEEKERTRTLFDSDFLMNRDSNIAPSYEVVVDENPSVIADPDIFPLVDRAPEEESSLIEDADNFHLNNSQMIETPRDIYHRKPEKEDDTNVSEYDNAKPNPKTTDDYSSEERTHVEYSDKEESEQEYDEFMEVSSVIPKTHEAYLINSQMIETRRDLYHRKPETEDDTNVSEHDDAKSNPKTTDDFSSEESPHVKYSDKEESEQEYDEFMEVSSVIPKTHEAYLINSQMIETPRDLYHRKPEKEDDTNVSEYDDAKSNPKTTDDYSSEESPHVKYSDKEESEKEYDEFMEVSSEIPKTHEAYLPRKDQRQLQYKKSDKKESGIVGEYSKEANEENSSEDEDESRSDSDEEDSEEDSDSSKILYPENGKSIRSEKNGSSVGFRFRKVEDDDDPPERPRRPRIKHVRSNRIILRWDPPKSGKVDSYSIDLAKNNATDFKPLVKDFTKKSYRMTLDPGNFHYFKIRSKNAVGTSPPLRITYEMDDEVEDDEGAYFVPEDEEDEDYVVVEE